MLKIIRGKISRSKREKYIKGKIEKIKKSAQK